MNKLTKEMIEQMAKDIRQYCKLHDYGCVIMYYNDKREFVDYSGHEDGEIQENINPHYYFDYCAYDHIFSMSSEGGLDLSYEILNGKGVYNIFKKYGVYAELGYSWNCSCYPEHDDMEVEYTSYVKPDKEITLHWWEEYGDKNINGLINTYRDAISIAYPKVNGSCVIGDGIRFVLYNQKYFFSTNYNQSDVVDEVIDACKDYLAKIGAAEIWYDYGRMD